MSTLKASRRSESTAVFSRSTVRRVAKGMSVDRFLLVLSELRIVRARVMAGRSSHVKRPRPNREALGTYLGLREWVRQQLPYMNAQTPDALEVCGEAFALIHEEVPWS